MAHFMDEDDYLDTAAAFFLYMYYDTHYNQGGLRHVRTVRSNRAADFRGAAFLDAKNAHINYVGQFEQL